MEDESIDLVEGEVLDEFLELSMGELCSACQTSAEQIFELVEHCVIEPKGSEPLVWRFQASSIKRVVSAQRLKHDLGVNTAGAALALDLLDELDLLREQLKRHKV